jgi:hypothetical protein
MDLLFYTVHNILEFFLSIVGMLPQVIGSSAKSTSTSNLPGFIVVVDAVWRHIERDGDARRNYII